LRAWSAQTDVPLRVVVHRGPVKIDQGEASALRPGELLPALAGMLDRSSEAGIVASEEFVAALGPRPGVEFHDGRRLRLKHDRPQVLHLMSLAGLADRSQWSDPIEEDHRRLQLAVKEGRGFDAVYYAKRLLQVNSEDPVVTWTLA